MGPPPADPQEEAKKESAAAEEVIRKAREKRALDAGRCDSDIPLEVRINGIRSMFWICSRSSITTSSFLPCQMVPSTVRTIGPPRENNQSDNYTLWIQVPPKKIL